MSLNANVGHGIINNSLRLLIVIACENRLPKEVITELERTVFTKTPNDKSSIIWIKRFEEIGLKHGMSKALINECIAQTLNRYFTLTSYDDVVKLYATTNRFKIKAKRNIDKFNRNKNKNDYDINAIINHFILKMTSGTQSNFDYTSSNSNIMGYLLTTFTEHYCKQYSSFVISVLNEMGTGTNKDDFDLAENEGLIEYDSTSSLQDFPGLVKDVANASKLLYDNKYDLFSYVMCSYEGARKNRIETILTDSYSISGTKPHVFSDMYVRPDGAVSPYTANSFNTIDKLLSLIEKYYNNGIYVDSIGLLYRNLYGICVANYDPKHSKSVLKVFSIEPEESLNRYSKFLMSNREVFMTLFKGYIAAKKLSDYVVANGIKLTSKDLVLFRSDLYYKRFRTFEEYLELGRYTQDLIDGSTSTSVNSLSSNHRTNDALYSEVLTKYERENPGISFNLATLSDIVVSQTTMILNRSLEESREGNNIIGSDGLYSMLQTSEFFNVCYREFTNLITNLRGSEGYKDILSKGVDSYVGLVYSIEFNYFHALSGKYGEQFNNAGLSLTEDTVITGFVELCSIVKLVDTIIVKYPVASIFFYKVLGLNSIEELQENSSKFYEYLITGVSSCVPLTVAMHNGDVSSFIRERLIRGVNPLPQLFRIVSFITAYVGNSLDVGNMVNNSTIDEILLPLEDVYRYHLSDDTELRKQLKDNDNSLDTDFYSSNILFKFPLTLIKATDIPRISSDKYKFEYYTSLDGLDIPASVNKELLYIHSLVRGQHSKFFRELELKVRKCNTQVGNLGLHTTVKRLPESLRIFNLSTAHPENPRNKPNSYYVVGHDGEGNPIIDENLLISEFKEFESFELTKNRIIAKLDIPNLTFKDGYVHNGIDYVRVDYRGNITKDGQFYIHQLNYLVKENITLSDYSSQVIPFVPNE